MKTKLYVGVAIAALGGATLFANGGQGLAENNTVMVEFLEPEKFTDFKISWMGGPAEQDTLVAELKNEINRLAAVHLPPGYRLALRFRDIDLAGDFEPQRRKAQDVRVVRGVYPPRLVVEFAVTSDDDHVVASGERKLTDISFQSRLRRGAFNTPHTEIEAGLLGDFMRELVKSLP